MKTRTEHRARTARPSRWKGALAWGVFAVGLPTAEVPLRADLAEPTSAAEAAALEQRFRGKVSPENFRAYRALVDALPPDEKAWEEMVEANVGADYLARHIRRRLATDWDPAESEWGYVRDDPKLPNVLVIGDSISRAYTVPLRRLLRGRANVHRAPANCGPTELGLKKLDLWLSQGSGRWDVISFNFGIHDRAKTPEAYAANLTTLVGRLKKTGAHLVWCRTTPFGIGDDGSDAVNRTADAVMAGSGVVSADLHVAIVPRRGDLQNRDGFHFVPDGSSLLAARLAETITPLLPSAPSANTSSYDETQ